MSAASEGPCDEGLDIHVDESAEAMARRFIDAWHRAERGEAVGA